MLQLKFEMPETKKKMFFNCNPKKRVKLDDQVKIKNSTTINSISKQLSQVFHSSNYKL